MPAPPGLSFDSVRSAAGWDVRYDLKDELGELINYLVWGFDILHDYPDYPPPIILSFDGAHTPTEASTDDVDGLWSRFGERGGHLGSFTHSLASRSFFLLRAKCNNAHLMPFTICPPGYGKDYCP